ncbi:Vacuolar protein sorting-associated protein 24 1 [Glycine soja]
MEKVMNILKPKPNPQQLLRDWQRRLRQECRNIERQIRDIQREEKNVQKAIREAAKRNDMGSAKALAKELVRSRQTVNRLYENKAQMNSISMHLGESVGRLDLNFLLPCVSFHDVPSDSNPYEKCILPFSGFRWSSPLAALLPTAFFRIPVDLSACCPFSGRSFRPSPELRQPFRQVTPPPASSSTNLHDGGYSISIGLATLLHGLRFFGTWRIVLGCTSTAGVAPLVTVWFAILGTVQSIFYVFCIVAKKFPVAYPTAVSFQRVFWAQPLSHCSFSNEELFGRLFCRCPFPASLYLAIFPDFTKIPELSSKCWFEASKCAIARTVGHLSKSAEVMKLVNNLMKAPEMAVTMQEFSKEMTKAGVIEEIVNDAVDSALDSEDIEDEIEEEVDKVLTAIAGETAAQLPEAVRKERVKLPAQSVGAEEDAIAEGVDDEEEMEEIRARLAKVRS